MAQGLPKVEHASPNEKRATYVSIQYLRAIAALMVVAWHALGQMNVAGPLVLQCGIEVFFIVSGFIMWIVSADEARGPGAFVARRMARIVPLYWTLTLLVAAVATLAPGVMQSLRLDHAHLLASLAFFAWPNPTPGVGLRPFLVPGWTLNYEVAFYLLVAASLWIRAPWRGPAAIGAILVVALISPLLPSGASIAHFYTAPLIVNFAIGIGLAMAFKAAPDEWSGWGAPMMAVGLGWLVWGAVVHPLAAPRLLWFSLPVALIVLGAILAERAGNQLVFKPLKVLGDASYPLYLVHTLLLSAMAQVWRRTALSGLPPEVFMGLGLLVSAVVGVSLHYSLEKPLTRIVQVRLASMLKSPPKSRSSLNPANHLRVR